MPATVTALRTGRQRALVQRPRRKIHLASIAAGDPEWLTFCDLFVTADGATFWIGDADTVAEEREEELCAHCHRLLMLAQLITVEHSADRALFTDGIAR